jgi:hypothetical protein
MLMTTKTKRAKYTAHRSTDGVDDTFDIKSPNGNYIMSVHFWEEPDTDEAAQAVKKAKQLIKALNMTGGWLEINVSSVLTERKQIAAIWSVEDVQQERPDLTEGQAWEVLQLVKRCHDCDFGINWETLRIAADDMFPKPKAAAS